MEKTFVLKDVAYAAKQGGGTITTAEEAHLLQEGAVAVFLDGNVISSVEPEDISPSKHVSIAVGYPTSTRDIKGTQRVRLSARFPADQVLRTEFTTPIDGVAKVMVISGFTDTVGEAVVRLYRKTYDVSNNLDRFSVSLDRREGETLDAFVTRFVDKFSTTVNNAGFTPKVNRIATATKVTSSNTIGIRFNGLSPDVEFDVAVDGIFANAVKTVSTERTSPVGAGIDVVKDEQDSTPMFGDSGYEHDDHFNRVGNAVPGNKYAALNIDVQRVHSSPTNRQNSMVSNITLYGVADDAGLAVAKAVFEGLTGKEAESV